MTDRQTTENPRTDPDEYLYTRVEVEVMIKETLAAKLVEIGYTPQTQSPTVPSRSEKGKEPEVVDPMQVENIATHRSELLKKANTPKEIIDISCGPAKGKSSMEDELEFLKKELTRIKAQYQTKIDTGYDVEEYSEDKSGKGPLEKWHKPAKFDGSGDPRVHLKQYALISKLNRLPADFMLEWFSTSLQGPALTWYHTLEKSKKSSWIELSKAFLEQFSFNPMTNVALRELENITQRPEESL